MELFLRAQPTLRVLAPDGVTFYIATTPQLRIDDIDGRYLSLTYTIQGLPGQCPIIRPTILNWLSQPANLFAYMWVYVQQMAGRFVNVNRVIDAGGAVHETGAGLRMRLDGLRRYDVAGSQQAVTISWAEHGSRYEADIALLDGNTSACGNLVKRACKDMSRDPALYQRLVWMSGCDAWRYEFYVLFDKYYFLEQAKHRLSLGDPVGVKYVVDRLGYVCFADLEIVWSNAPDKSAELAACTARARYIAANCGPSRVTVVGASGENRGSLADIVGEFA